MRLSYEWLSSYVDLDGVSAEQLAHLLTSAGLEVEGVEPRCDGELVGVKVGEVLSVEPHPNADRLRVCLVNLGEGDPSTIVCGAPNVAVGQKVPVAVPGSLLPGGRIGVAKLRGIESHGMLCSAKEIGLETRLLPREQTEGLYVLPASAKVGEDVLSLLRLNDTVLDISLTPNRSDCLSMRGLAYEVGALLNRRVHFDTLPESTRESSAALNGVSLRLDTSLCRAYEAQVFTNVRVGESPLWMQMRLMAMGIRPISNIVDVTNYVMLEWGQPLHAFDLDEVHESTIVVRMGNSGETMTTLDGVERQLTEDTLVIADVHRPIGIAGVMGGANSEIHEGTARVVLESAAFDATSVRRTGQRLGLHSEASQRFEKGVDGVAVHQALLRATQLLSEIGAATPVGTPVIAQNETAPTNVVPFSPHGANRLLGTQIPLPEMDAIFSRLGFKVDVQGEDDWNVTVPSRRWDIRMQADLVEEVARIHGYDAIPSSLPVGATTVGLRNASQRLRKVTREALTSQGMFEVFPYTFTHASVGDALRLDKDHPHRIMVPLLHPLSEERILMRTHLLPGLSEIARHNLAHGEPGGQIFEIGRVYLSPASPPTRIPDEPLVLGMLWFGDEDRWFGMKRRAYDFFDAKGIVFLWLQSLGLMERVTLVRSEDPWLHPGKSADVLVDGRKILSFGEVHPETGTAFEIGRAVYGEAYLDEIHPLLAATTKVARLPRFPGVTRDLAVLVPLDVEAGQLVATAKSAAWEEPNSGLIDCTVFDVYDGKGIPQGQKSVAVSFVYRLSERTMTEAEVEATQARVVERWQRDFDAKLRAGI